MAKIRHALFLLTAIIFFTFTIASSSLDENEGQTSRMGAGEKAIKDCLKKCKPESVETDCPCGVEGAGGLNKTCGKDGLCKYCGKYRNYCSFGETGEGDTGAEFGKVVCCDKIGDDGSIQKIPCRKPPSGRTNPRWRCFANVDWSS